MNSRSADHPKIQFEQRLHGSIDVARHKGLLAAMNPINPRNVTTAAVTPTHSGSSWERLLGANKKLTNAFPMTSGCSHPKTLTVVESEIAWTEFAVVANVVLRVTSNYAGIIKIGMVLKPKSIRFRLITRNRRTK